MTAWTGLKRKANRARLRIKVWNKSPLQKAIEWVKSHRIPGSGVVTHHRTDRVTQEVTGYLIPTLYNAGEKQLACDLARWEASVQRADGGFVCPTADVPYTFDTAQVIRGFLAVLDDLPELESHLRRACDYVERHIAPDGEVLHDSYETWRLPDGMSFSPYCNLYALPPLAEAGRPAFVFCDYYRFNGEDVSLGAVHVELPDDPRLDKGNCIGYCFLYSREVRDRVGDYDLDARLAEDYDYWIRVSRQFPLVHLHEPLYLTRFHDKSLYATRYWEVKLVDFLLRLKYDLLDTGEVARLFINLVAMKRKRLCRVRRAVAGLLIGTRVDHILKSFQVGQVNLEAAKLQLQTILRKWPV